MWQKYEIYEGTDLGAVYSPQETVFRLWAPEADSVVLRLYKSGSGVSLYRSVPMDKDEGGTWVCRVEGDLDGVYYTYLICSGDEERESYDPYAKAAGVNGMRSMVVCLEKTDPPGFAEEGICWAIEGGVLTAHGGRGCGQDSNPPGSFLMDLPHAVVTEISVRDMTADDFSGVSEEWRGRFLGLTERGTVDLAGNPSGLDYLRSLGVTHVQIMPFYDFGSIDEAAPLEGQYNWGYDPVNYNVPEGSYATDAGRGEVRIRECKQMIAAIHRAGMGVVMDVVFNHVYDAESSAFHLCAPGYFFRMDGEKYSNASGCGNEIASERPMVRKYILDSLKYWVQEYHIDGFRFDLMGVLDVGTMRQVREELLALNPNILIYGEGWTCSESVLQEKQRALKKNSCLVPGVGMFSDDMRDTIKGNVFLPEDTGFVNGSPKLSEELRFAVAAAVKHPQVKAQKPWAPDPCSVVNYVSCHDNLTLWDKLMLTQPEAWERDRVAMNQLAAAIIFTSQGMPFFLCGEEAARTKPDGEGGYLDNSYQNPVEINRFDYDRLTEYSMLTDYYRGLIQFRKTHADLWYTDAEQLAKGLRFQKTRKGVVAFTLRGDGESAFVVYNGRVKPSEVELPEGEWEICVDGEQAGIRCLRKKQGTVSVHGISALVGIQRDV